MQGCICGLSLNAGTQDEVPRPAAIAAPWGWLERQIQFTFPLWAIVWRVLRKLKTELPYNLAIPGIYPQKIMIWKGTYTLMLTAVLFMIAKTWKQPNVRGQRMDKEDEVHIYNGMLPSHWKELQQHGWTQRLSYWVKEGELIVWRPLYVESKKKWYKWTYKTERDSQTWRTNLWLPGWWMGARDSWGVWDGLVHTAVLKWVTDKDLPYRAWNSAQCCVVAWMGGEFEEEWTHVYVSGSLHCSPETAITLFVNWLCPSTK